MIRGVSLASCLPSSDPVSPLTLRRARSPRQVFIINNHGQPRATKFFETVSTAEQQQLIREIFFLVQAPRSHSR